MFHLECLWNPRNWRGTICGEGKPCTGDCSRIVHPRIHRLPNTNTSDRCGISPLGAGDQRCQKETQTVQVTIFALGCPLEHDCKSPLLKTPCMLAMGEIKMELIRKHLPIDRLSVLEGTMQAAGGRIVRCLP